MLTRCPSDRTCGLVRGWQQAASYEAGTDTQAAYNGHPSAYLKAKGPVTGGFGTLMQDFRADAGGRKSSEKV